MSNLRSDPDRRFLYKIILTGDSGVGKTCLLLKYIDNVFYEWCTSTIGVDFKVKTCIMDNERVKLQLWDTTGLERFRSITSGYYRGSHGIIVVFDLTNIETFKNLEKWIGDINKYKNDFKSELYPYVILVGMKSDLIKKREVSREVINKFCDDNKIKYIEASAKNGDGINEIFEDMCTNLMKMPQSMETKHDKDVITLKSTGPVHDKQTKKCCNIL